MKTRVGEVKTLNGITAKSNFVIVLKMILLHSQLNNFYSCFRELVVQ